MTKSIVDAEIRTLEALKAEKIDTKPFYNMKDFRFRSQLESLSSRTVTTLNKKTLPQEHTLSTGPGYTEASQAMTAPRQRKPERINTETRGGLYDRIHRQNY